MLVSGILRIGAGASVYEVQRARGPSPFVAWAEATKPTWQDRAVAFSQRYRYRVVARHGLQASAASEFVQITCVDR